MAKKRERVTGANKDLKINPDKIPDLGVESTEVKPATYDLKNPPVYVDGLKLNLGSGRDYRKGYINIDKYDSTADLVADITNLPFSDNSVAQIYSSETLEHISRDEIPMVLKECHRVLKMGGNLVLVVPDMVAACERFLANPEDDWQLARIYGSQNHAGQFHKWGFTPKRLFKMLGEAGFVSTGVAYFKEDNGVRNLFAEAFK